MMRYVTNHPFDFISPSLAFLIALMQFSGGLGAEVICILYLGSFDNPFHVLLRFIALASIARVDDIYFATLSSTLKITKPSKQLKIRVHRRDWSSMNARAEISEDEKE